MPNKQFPQTITAVITAEHMEGEYTNGQDCPLARAMKEKFNLPVLVVPMYPDGWVNIFKDKVYGNIAAAYRYSPSEWNGYIFTKAQATPLKPFTPITLTLTLKP